MSIYVPEAGRPGKVQNSHDQTELYHVRRRERGEGGTRCSSQEAQKHKEGR